MKLSILLVLSLVTMAVCNVKEPFFKKQAPEQKCSCTPKTCDVVSCQELRCIRVNQKLDKLESNEAKPYPTTFVKKYRSLWQQFCQCILACLKNCDPKELHKCEDAAYNRFLAKVHELFKEIRGKKGAEEFIDNVNTILIDATNDDCESACETVDEYNPFHYASKKGVVKKALEKGVKKFRDEDVRRECEQFVDYIDIFVSHCETARNHRDEKKQKALLESAFRAIESELQQLLEDVTRIRGRCTGAVTVFIMGQMAAAALDTK